MPWRDAWGAALYGENGFYRRNVPGRHFRTSVHASPQFARAIVTLARRRGLRDLVDYGAGSGELLRQVAALAPDLSLTAVELRRRPADLPAMIRWVHELPTAIEGLLVGNELLDNVPCDVVEYTPSGLRIVEVEAATGAERLGGPPGERLCAWVARWWPSLEPGDRAEVGLPRDEFWSQATQRLTSGVSVAIDYGHLLDYRPLVSTVRSYQAGHETPVRLDGQHDVTSHVSIDSLAQCVGGSVTRQRDALLDLGLVVGRPDVSLATTDPAHYVRALSVASEAAELIASPGLGDLLWVVATHGEPA